MVFVLKAGPSWVKLKLRERERPRGFTVRVLSIKQTNKQICRKTDGPRPTVTISGFGDDLHTRRVLLTSATWTLRAKKKMRAAILGKSASVRV